jgi:hypothetical protein
VIVEPSNDTKKKELGQKKRAYVPFYSEQFQKQDFCMVLFYLTIKKSGKP